MRALVTNCTRNSGLAVMHALARGGWSVQGVDDRVFPLGLRSRYAREGYTKLPAFQHPEFTGALLAVLDRTRPDVLLPSRGVDVIRRARNEILARTRCLLPASEAYDVLGDKARLLELCAELGIPGPRVFSPDEATAWLRDTPDARIVVKPRRDIGGGADVHFVRDPAALAAIHRGVEARHGAALVTDYIPGPTDNLRAVHLLFDMESRLIAFFVLRKHRIWPAGVGVTVAAESTHEVDLVERLLPLFTRLRWQGPADAEIKMDDRDGVPRILEINPRFSGAVQFPIACGVNLPDLYGRAALGERLPECTAPAYPEGMCYIDGTRWLAGVVSELRQAGTSRADALRRIWRDELARPRVPSVYTLKDPGAILGKLLMTVSRRRGVTE